MSESWCGENHNDDRTCRSSREGTSPPGPGPGAGAGFVHVPSLIETRRRYEAQSAAPCMRSVDVAFVALGTGTPRAPYRPPERVRSPCWTSGTGRKACCEDSLKASAADDTIDSSAAALRERLDIRAHAHGTGSRDNRSMHDKCRFGS